MSKEMENTFFPAMESINQDTILTDPCQEDEIDGNNNEQIKVADSLYISKASPENILDKAKLLEENRLLRMEVDTYRDHISLCEMKKDALSSKLSEVKSALEKKKSELLESDDRYKSKLELFLHLAENFHKEPQLKSEVKMLRKEVENLKIISRKKDQVIATLTSCVVGTPVSPSPHRAPVCHRCTPKLAPTHRDQDSGIHTPINSTDGDPSYGRRYCHKNDELDPISEYDESFIIIKDFQDTFEN